MSHPRITLEVARWEFTRHFKLKQQLVGMLIMLVSGLGVYGVFRVMDRETPVEIAVVGEALDIAPHLPERFALTSHPPASDRELVAAVAEGELDGLLRVESHDRAELVTRREGEWIGVVRSALAAARQSEMLRRSAIDPQVLGSILTPPTLDVLDTGEQRRGGGGERLTLIMTLAAMLMTIFLGLGYVFSSITGEKQIRVTEQVVSAIRAQTWIDGKILGLLAVSLASVAFTALSFLVMIPFLRLLGSGFSLDLGTTDPGAVLVILAFGVLGLLFWFVFLVAVAAMIDDPNNSARGPLLFVPMLATSIGFLALRDPESPVVRLAALFPPTAPAAMPARMLLAPVPALEVALSLVLLAASVVLLRIAAGRIFRLGMLMYGKEPSWAEVRRWVRTP